jgi:hypothetical protein
MKLKLLVLVITSAIVAIGALPGCAGVGVQVWDRDVLARPEMQPDAGALDKALDDHIYFSKEAASGGDGLGGGGCGCN